MAEQICKSVGRSRETCVEHGEKRGLGGKAVVAASRCHTTSVQVQVTVRAVDDKWRASACRAIWISSFIRRVRRTAKSDYELRLSVRME